MNAYQLFRETREDYVENFIPRLTTDEMTPFHESFIDVGVYHYDRRDEIVSGVTDFVIDKARSKVIFTAAYTYARRNPRKFAAKVLTRGIPYVGWALLAYDAIQLYQWYQE
jgi:hypothetical protein